MAGQDHVPEALHALHSLNELLKAPIRSNRVFRYGTGIEILPFLMAQRRSVPIFSPSSLNTALWRRSVTVFVSIVATEAQEHTP
ncbi:hypothetical protein EUGRSUZ_L01517 [Eucalyptus grandis]|uniref:Uncharacterized protein n=1 Tax=Eucalyptus grandis TaxID=71139 RepID=A0A058ZSW4_EUCGR|nr:hypothetical protein EUGRSUZ_L01517 [Eucalyptus grandis]